MARSFSGLHVPTSLALDGAPAAARNLAASFPEGTLTGDISFDAPVTFYDETAASGKVEYTVTADGELVARGNTMYGTKGIAVTYTAEQPGWVTFAVTFSNESGNSPVSKIRVFVGNGTPSPARKATAAYDRATSTMNVSWLPVTTSADGGYIDPAKVTYAIFDADAPADAAPLAKDLTANEWSTVFAEPTDYTFYSYRIIAYFEGVASGASVTNVVPLGAMTPAVSYGFDAGLTGWTVINANGDDYTWEPYNEGTVSIRWNSAVPMDDWLISMPLRLEGGKMYDVVVDVWKSSATWAERFEIKYGSEPTAEAMTETLVPAGDLQPADTRKPLSGRILCENDGIVYIGLHGCSDADRYRIIIKDFKVSEGVSSAVPEACAGLTVAPHAAGVKKADITFDAPTLTAAGNPLGALTRIDLKRDGKLIKSFAAPAAGESLSFTDEVASPGTYTYTVVACNSEGEGIAAETSAYIGFALPAAPAFATLIEGETVGTAAIAWAPVTEDVNGTPLASGDVTYTVCINTNTGWQPIVEGLVLPAYSYQAIPEGDQDLFQYAVFAVNEAGVGLGATTELKPLGTPYSYLEETFADCKFHYVWAVGGDYDWGLCGDEFFTDITSVTQDGGFIAGQGTSYNQSGTIYSAFMSLAGLENPALIFYVNNINGDNINTLKVEVSERNGDWIPLVDSDIASESSAPGWNRITCLLDRFEGKTIQFRLSSAIMKYGWLLIDDIVIAELPDHDLAAETIEAPATVATGEAYAVNVSVRNVGANMADAYKVELSADGEVVKTFEGTSLKPGAASSFRYDTGMAAIATEPVTWSARVVYDKDLKADNDITQEIAVAPLTNILPVVTDLSADGIRLSWGAPDITGIAKAPVTVDFEDGESFAREYKDWTVC